jgi:predicted Fe-S protein YdhL (DUF1289 family)
MFPRKPPRVKSPCVNVCVMDEAGGMLELALALSTGVAYVRSCRGGAPRLDEITDWVRYSDRERQAVIDALPGREVELITPPAAYESQF